MSEQGRTQRLRITFSKGEAIKYISHLDLARALERAFRRAELPLVYSQGFNPRPKFSIASALPVGVTGRAEVMDIWLSPPLDPREVVASLNAQLPPGLSVLEAREVALHLPALQAVMRWAEYRVVLDQAEPGLAERIAALMAQPALPREQSHKGQVRQHDLRPLIAELALVPGEDTTLHMRLANGSQGTARVEEVLDALGLAGKACAVERVRLIWDEPQ